MLASVASARVLLVGTYHGIKGKYSSIQAAVNAAKPGDWILIGPGDYKTTSSRAAKGASTTPGAVLITTPNLHMRGMNRNTVIVDGTKAGAICNAKTKDQNFGPKSASGPLGLNGILVYKANNVSVENLTACNFLAGSGEAGNGFWWNGNHGSGKIEGYGFYGAYLTATSMYFAGESTAAAYGIFSSGWSGGTWYQTYASNMNDSGYYIGACQNRCHQTIDHGWGQYNALGYSGTNSGGWLLVENSQFDHNEDGFDTNSENNDDWPSPQSGACPHGVKPPIKGAHSCWVLYRNNIHDNNNPNVPAAGAAAAGPVGTGVSISGGRDDTIMDNTFKNNGAWGVIMIPFPDFGTPPAAAPSCAGGQANASAFGLTFPCLYDNWDNALTGNKFTSNGFFGNPTNGDFAELTATTAPSNCFSGNTDTGGTLTSWPAGLQQNKPTCGGQVPADSTAALLGEVLCDSQDFGVGVGCAPTDNYPRRTKIVMHRLPKLPTMPNPCAGVPKNAWCKA
jgi:hypothetical protein